MKKLIFFCSTTKGDWAKAWSMKDAKKKAYIGGASMGVKAQYVLWVAIFNPFDNDADAANIMDCITCNQIKGTPEFYQDDRTAEDTTMINKYFIGWAEVEDTRS